MTRTLARLLLIVLGPIEFAMAFSLFIWVVFGTYDQGYPVLGIVVTIILGVVAVAFSPLMSPPGDLSAAEEATPAALLVLLFRLALSMSCVAAVLWMLSQDIFPR